MAVISSHEDQESTKEPLLTTTTPLHQIPKDSFHLAYIIYFTLGAGSLLAWNSFITAIDYFSYLYPGASVDRAFSVIYMLVVLLCVSLIIICANRLNTYISTNVGLILFMISLLIIPIMDVVYIKGRVGLYNGYYVTIAAVGLAGVADALVQGGVTGSAGELPGRYMQAIYAGGATSGVLVSFLRIITKSVFSQEANGLRKSANIFFVFTIVYMAICIMAYNLLNHLPVIKYYKELKTRAAEEDTIRKESVTGSPQRSTLWEILGRIKWFAFGILLIYIVTLSIFPGYITEDVHSQSLKDWYPILLITCYDVFDLVGKCLTACYLFENLNVAVGACVGRLMFYPLLLGCLHGPRFFRTEIPVAILTGLLGLTNGYLTSGLMILAPKAVQIQHSATAGIVMVLFLHSGLLVGSVISWLWVI
ncbi:Epsin-1 [Ranunculus cassubicifolius]